MPKDLLAERCREVDAFSRENLPYAPDVAVVLGSGMGSVTTPYLGTFFHYFAMGKED